MAALARLRLPRSPVETSIEARAFVLSAFAVAVLAIVVYGQDYVIPPLALVAAAAGHWVSHRERFERRSFWRQALLAGLIFVALFYVVADSTLAIFGGTLPQANFALLLVAITSFDLKTRRNCYSSLWISLAVIYLAAVYAWDYAFAIFLALWVVCLAGFWMASHLRRMQARVTGPPAAIATAMVWAAVGGLVLFAFIPQPAGFAVSPAVISLPSFAGFKGDIENPALPLVQVSGGQAGATGSVDLHYRGRLGDAPVMYVRSGAPAYWRGLVFDTYRNGAWTASIGDYSELPSFVPPKLLPPAPPDNLGTFVQTFRVLRPLPGVIDAAYPIESLYAPVAALREDAYGTFHTPDLLRPGQTYSVVSYLPNLSPAVLRSDEPSTIYAPQGNPSYLDYGSLSPRARALADRIASDPSSLFDLVMAVTAYLQHNYRYTLDLRPVPSGRDPVDFFLFDTKTGYCEQFATAETLLLRYLGVPARLATGYSTGDYDPVLDQAVVRERDAHAWVEAWFPAHGWVPVDPTPGVDPLAATKFPGHWAAGGVARLLPHLTIGAPAAVLGSAGVMGAIVPALVAGAGAALLYAWIRRRSWRRGGPSPQPGEPELLRLYERLQRRMDRRRGPPETPLEYLHAMQDQPQLEELTEMVNRGVYGGRWPGPREVRELAQRLS